jgi:hypothetical protein
MTDEAAMMSRIVNILETLRQAQEAPEYYFGSLCHLVENNQARSGFMQHRDSDILDVSNFDTIYADLSERFGDDDTVIEIDRANHWAVGWSEEILVPAWIDPTGPESIENVHPAFLAAMQWHETLSDYPVADDEDYSRREYEDTLETLENCYSVSSENSPAVFSWLFNNYSVCRGDDIRDEWITEATAALGLVDMNDV